MVFDAPYVGPIIGDNEAVNTDRWIGADDFAADEGQDPAAERRKMGDVATTIL